MALILSIDTAFETAGICLAQDGNVVGEKYNATQTDHAGWIHTAIHELLNASSKNIRDIDAIAVTSGPGSYTGLRVSMATAKGMCFSLNIPLIIKDTLSLSAQTVKKSIKGGYSSPVLYCPMVDARRMEVYTALYDAELQEIMPPAALILDAHSFEKELEQHTVIFSGNGSGKWQNICPHPNAVFSNVMYHVSDLAIVAEDKYHKQEFGDLAYTEPLYVKNVYTGLK